MYDIAIIGGGLVGASLACALHDSQLRIALIDAAPENAADPRLIALNYHSCHLLKNLDVWPHLSAHAAPIQQVHVSDRGHFGITRITAAELNLEYLGHVIPAKYINAALYEKLATLKNIELLRPARLLAIKNSTQLTLSNDTTIDSRWIIGADGTHSSVRELAGISSETIDYQQSAVVTITTVARAHQGIAYERFSDGGAIAMLPLPGLQVATIWTSHTPVITELMTLTDEAFLQQLQKKFGYRLGRLLKIAKRHVFPLQKIIAEKTLQDNILLLGNAASTLHPIAAQGLNLALHNVTSLVKIFAENGLNTASFQQYCNGIQTHQTRTLQFSHRLIQLFSTDCWPVNLARNIGLTALDIFPLAKQKLAKQLIGGR